MAGEKALENCVNSVKYINKKNIPGDICEFGVAQGGAALALCLADKYYKNNSKRNFFLFDSFEGLPKPNPKLDFNKHGLIGKALFPLEEGTLFSDYINTKNLFFKKNNFSKKKIFFVKGFFEKTAKNNFKKIKKISILRLDGDWFDSVYIPLTIYYSKVSKGGIIIIDDYLTCVGAKRAVSKFLKKNKIHIKKKYYGKGGMYFIK